jgi:hypothetical protein
MSAISLIHDLVRTGRATPEQGAMLIELRQRLLWKRRPWWQRLLIVAGRVVLG